MHIYIYVCVHISISIHRVKKARCTSGHEGNTIVCVFVENILEENVRIRQLWLPLGRVAGENGGQGTYHSHILIQLCKCI